MTRNPEHARQLASRFHNHVAEYSEGVIGGLRVERMRWRQPGTSNYAIEYLCLGGTLLFVAGDLGEATYNAGAKEMQWWVRCDLDYFAGKCQASEHGRGFEDFDSDACVARFQEEVARLTDDGDTPDLDAVAAGLDAARSGRHEWDAWMRESASDLFGDEWWDYVPNFGVVIARRCELHLVGLKMAFAQIAERAATAGAA